jgi:hypothetical protein
MLSVRKLSGAFAEFTVGSMVVLYHLSLARRLDAAAPRDQGPHDPLDEGSHANRRAATDAVVQHQRARRHPA